jgi:hypothetical protein
LVVAVSVVEVGKFEFVFVDVLEFMNHSMLNKARKAQVSDTTGDQ